MFKKLDKLIVRAFIGPFIATFFLTLLVLVMQFFWLYIDDFVGKGLSAGVIMEFIWYQSAVLIPLALPLAILLSSLMTFGNLGESFELVALRSSGISLLRFMRPLFFLTILICGVAFLFSNYIIPVANLKSTTLLWSITHSNPSFDLKEGVFYDKIKGFAIKVGKKEPNDSVLRDVIIYEQNNALQDNFIMAKSAVMKMSDDKYYLEFNLKDGWRYQERGDMYNQDKTEYIRIGFKEYQKRFDIREMLFSRIGENVFKNNERMYSMQQLNSTIDSLEKQRDAIRLRLQKQIFTPYPFVKYLDSIQTTKITINKPDDSLLRAKSLDEILPDSARRAIHDDAIGKVSALRTSTEIASEDLKNKEKELRKHQIEWHRKIALSVACLVLFLIGAPLGSIIRKGGVGTPLIFAIIFFMVFYFSSTTGEKFAKENSMSAFAGMWLSTFVLLPMGIFLTYKAMKDSQLFSKEFYYRFAKFLSGIFKRQTE